MSAGEDVLVCGIDGGQTATRCVLANQAGQVLGHGHSLPLTHLNASGGRERFGQSITQALQHAWADARLEPLPLAALVVGATGIVAGSREAESAKTILANLVQSQTVHVCSDAQIALAGAHGGSPGIIVIAGTGTIAMGIDGNGRVARAGGWGWLIGDDGSAFAIGRAGLKAALYARDGIGRKTLLESMMAQHFDVVDLYDTKRIVYAPHFGARGFAGLAPVVSHAAARQDPAALRIIQEAGQALAQETLAVMCQLDFKGMPAVAPLGGAFENLSGVSQAFSAALNISTASYQLTRAQMPAVLGAVIMALERCQVESATVLARLQSQAQGIESKFQPRRF
jgi:N-acetylglucosamine kinase-like BadF-type ATPase